MTAPTNQKRSAAHGIGLQRLAWPVWALVLAGCATPGMHFDAATLPADFRVPPQANARTVDLSRLASSYSSNEQISSGDVLDVTISAGLTTTETVSFPVRVNDQGIAKLPIVGELSLAGLELPGAEAAIVAACVQRGLYTSPNVTVTMKRQRTNRVTVVGAVEKPGIYELPRDSSDLLAAIVAAGGLSEDAGTHVEIRTPANGSPDRPRDIPKIAEEVGPELQQLGHSFAQASRRPQSFRVDLASATEDGTGGYSIPDGGVIMVEKQDPMPVHVIGLVRKPGRYDFPVGQDLHVLDALALAGGTSSSVADKVFVIRPVAEHGDPAVIEVSLRKAKRQGIVNVRLAPGDVVSVEQTPATVLMEAIQVIRFGIGASLNPLF